MNGVYWIYGDVSASLTPERSEPSPLAPLPLAVVLCPRGGSYLHREILHLRRAGIQTLVSLLSPDQVEMLELTDEPLVARQLGIDFLSHPIPDHQVPPDPKAFRAFVSDLANRVRSGQRIGVHCWGSIGRATVTAACTLIHLGWEPARALTAVEAARGCPVPDTEEQQAWILRYKADAEKPRR